MPTILRRIALLLLLSLTLLSTSQSVPTRGALQGEVAFRIDDIQASWISSVQEELVNYFVKNQIKATLGVLSVGIGEDAKVLKVLKDGVATRTLEIADHGWDHRDFSALSYAQQLELMTKAREKIQQVLPGTLSVTFVPPYNFFNADTLRAARSAGFTRISASLASDPPPWDQSSILHYPSTVDGASFMEGVPINRPTNQVTASIVDSISKFGYAIVLLHPQEFAVYVGNKVTDEIDQNAMNHLHELVGWVKSNAKVVQIQEISAIPVPEYSRGSILFLVISGLVLVLGIGRRRHRRHISPT
ncbi:MAG: polysaccharide deacetylase family protein [archaeon]